MTKKEIINTLREMGFKANYRNVLISTYEEKGYITVIQNKTEMYIVTKEMLENKTNKKDIGCSFSPTHFMVVIIC